MSQWALLLLALLVAVLAYHHAKRHGSTLIALCMAVVLGAATHQGVEAAVAMIMDGEVADWSGIAPIATDPGGDSSSADSAEDIRAAFITFDGQTLYFRLDVADAALPLPGQVTGLDLIAASDSGASNSDNLTNDSTPTFSWNSLAGASGYKFSDDGGSSWTDLGMTTSWTHGGLADGSHYVLVRGYNVQGDGMVSATLVVVIDIDNPIPTFTSFNVDQDGTYNGTLTATDTNTVTFATSS